MNGKKELIVMVDPETGEPVTECYLEDNCNGNFYDGTLCGGCDYCIFAQALFYGLKPYSEEYAIGWYAAKIYSLENKK